MHKIFMQYFDMSMERELIRLRTSTLQLIDLQQQKVVGNSFCFPRRTVDK